MSNNIKYIAKYQKANTIQVNIRLSKKYDADVIEKLNSLDNTGKSTYIKKLIREDIARTNGEASSEVHEENSAKEELSSEKADDKSLTVAELAVAIGSSVPTISAWYRWKRENPEHEYGLDPDSICLGKDFQITEEVRLRMDTVTDEEGNEWFPLFTDEEELHKQPTSNIIINSPIREILRNGAVSDRVKGVVINPFGERLALPQDVLKITLKGMEEDNGKE